MDKKCENNNVQFSGELDPTTSDDLITDSTDSDKQKAKNTDTFYGQVYLTQNENDFYSEDDYDLSGAELSDSDQTEITFMNNSSSGMKEKSRSKSKNRLKTHSYMNGSSTNRLRSNSFNGVKKKISCIMWEANEWKGVDLSMNEISNYILTNVKKASFSLDYFYIGILFSIVIGCKYYLYIYFNFDLTYHDPFKIK